MIVVGVTVPITVIVIIGIIILIVSFCIAKFSKKSPSEDTDGSSNGRKIPIDELTNYYKITCKVEEAYRCQLNNRFIVAIPTKRLLPLMKGKEIIIEFIEGDEKVSIEDQKKFNERFCKIFNTGENNIVRYFRVTKVQDHLIVMQEHMESRDLEQYLKKRNSDGNSHDTQQLIKVCAQIANGMKYLHSCNIIHGKIAARALWVEECGEDLNVKFCDFSMYMVLSKNNDKYRKNTIDTSLSRWWATECFQDFKVTPKTEVWAFGITMWEIFTHCENVPYHTMNIKELIEDARKGARRKLLECPDCTDEVIQLMKSCWNHDPSKRPDIGKLHEVLINQGTCNLTSAE